jgi:hypothetical protein
VSVAQLTSQRSAMAPAAGVPAEAAEAVAAPPRAPAGSGDWRRVLGGFTLSIPIRDPGVLLPVEERQLSLLRWVLSGIPPTADFYPTFRAYVDVYAGRVAQLGGDPEKIPPTPTGTWRGGPQLPERPRRPTAVDCYTGKVERIAYDRFGEFEGFVVVTEQGPRIEFTTHERRMGELVTRTMAEGLTITVECTRQHPHAPLRVLLHAPRWHA